jgi:hypothetical protein
MTGPKTRTGRPSGGASSLRERRADLVDLVEKGSPEASPTSIAGYVARLGVVRERFHEDQGKPHPDKHDHQWLTKAAEVCKFVENEWSNINSRNITFEALAAGASAKPSLPFEQAAEIYRVAVSELSEKQRNRYLTQAMSESEKSKWMDYEAVAAKVRAFRDANWPPLANLTEWTEEQFRMAQDVLIVSLYGDNIPPLRNEWATVRVRSFDQKIHNYIDFSKKAAVFCKFKTAAVYGDNVVEIGDLDGELWDMVVKTKEMNGGSPFLLTNSNGDPYLHSGAFSQHVGRLFERITDKRLASSMLRKVFVTHISSDQPRLTDQLTLGTVARTMGHSPAVQASYRRFDEGPLDKRIEDVKRLKEKTPGHRRASGPTLSVSRIGELMK